MVGPRRAGDPVGSQLLREPNRQTENQSHWELGGETHEDGGLGDEGGEGHAGRRQLDELLGDEDTGLEAEEDTQIDPVETGRPGPSNADAGEGQHGQGEHQRADDAQITVVHQLRRRGNGGADPVAGQRAGHRQEQQGEPARRGHGREGTRTSAVVTGRGQASRRPRSARPMPTAIVPVR